jgi:hypothetical protein
MSDSFSDWTAKMAEAVCVFNKIPCKRKFTDMELKRPLEQLEREWNSGADLVKRDKEVPQWERELMTGARDRTVGG